MNLNQIELSNSEIKKMHDIQFYMLCEFDKLCRKHDIKYILEGGSLLGAVRHKGFIPWDDDIDIRMLRTEYEKFCKVAEELPEEIFFQSYKSDPGYLWLYSKLRMNGTEAVRIGQDKLSMHSGIFIDIFPCDGVPDNEKIRKRHNRITYFCRKILFARTAKNSTMNIFIKMGFIILCIIPRKLAYLISEYLSLRYTEKNCQKVGIHGWHGIEDAVGFPQKYFKELTELDFEGRKFYVPKEYDEYLRFTFGDNYMEIPSNEKQTKNHGLIFLDFGKYS